MSGMPQEGQRPFDEQDDEEQMRAGYRQLVRLALERLKTVELESAAVDHEQSHPW